MVFVICFSTERCIPNCLVYSEHVRDAIKPLLGNSGWTLQRYEDSRKFGLGSIDALAWPYPNILVAFHSFVTISYKSETVDWVLDPWGTNRPDIYHPIPFLNVWPQK